MSDLIDLLVEAKAKLEAATCPGDQKLYEFYQPNEYKYYLRQGWLNPGETRGIAGGEIRIIHKWPEKPLTVAEYEALTV